MLTAYSFWTGFLTGVVFILMLSVVLVKSGKADDDE